MAGLYIQFEQAGAPNGVEYKRLNTPATLAEWQEKAKTALSEKGNFVEVETKADAASGKTQKLLLNVTRVLNVVQE